MPFSECPLCVLWFLTLVPAAGLENVSLPQHLKNIFKHRLLEVNENKLTWAEFNLPLFMMLFPPKV